MPSIGKVRSKPAPRGPAKVTVLNGDPEAGEIVARVLEAAGHQVARAFDADNALVALSSDIPSLGVIDLGGGANNPGLRLLEAIRGHPNASVKNLRVVLISSQPGGEMFAWLAGTDGYLERPVHADQITEAVADVLARPDKQRPAYRTQAHQAALDRH